MAGSTLQLVKCEPDSFLDALNKFSDWTKSQNGELSRMKSSQLRVLFRMRPGVNWRLGDVGRAPSGRTLATTEEQLPAHLPNDITSFSHLILRPAQVEEMASAP